MKALYLEPFAGISGNMLLGALLDAGVPFEYLQEEFAKLHLGDYELVFKSVNKSGIQARYFNVLLPEEQDSYFPLFNVNSLLRGDYQSRMQGYAVARQNGWMSANDIRELENLDRIPESEGGDLYLINGNMTKLKDAGIFAANGKEKDEEVLELDESKDSESGNRRRKH
jgi:hypothetical protein